MRLRSFLLPLVLLAIAAQLVQLGVTRPGVGPAEYAVLGAAILLLVARAAALLRRAARVRA